MLRLALLMVSISISGAFAAGKKAPAESAAADASGGKVWVVRPDGAQSCGLKAGQSVEDASEDLKKAGISIFESSKGNDGKMYMQMCGAPTGSVNATLISQSDLPKALALGFKEAPQGFKKASD